MHEAVTNSSTLTKNFSQSNTDDLQTPISRKPRLHSTDSFGWSQGSDPNSEYNQENWPLSHEPLPPHLTTGRRANSASLQKISYSSNMPTRTDNNTSDRSQPPGQRWRFNTNGQLVDSEAASWELADEIVRLKIGEVTGDDSSHASLRTPAKSKLGAQLNEASPLETSSSTSIGSSPHASENEICIVHSRGSSTDTTISSSRGSVASISNKPPLAKPPLKVDTGSDIKERPHSFSGGLSTADLRRLQQAGEAPDQQQHRVQGHYRDNMVTSTEQVSYPSLANHIHRPQPQPHPQLYDYRSGTSQLNQAADQDEIQMGYTMQQRNFNPIPQGHPLIGAATGATFLQGRPSDNISLSGYRQTPRGYPQPGVTTNPPAMGYPTHTPHLSLGNTQQLYDMMLPGPHHEHPAVTRVQQQHNIYRPTHHHSASDPSASIRDATALALMSNSLQPFAPGVFQPGMPMPLYSSQYYAGTQDQYPLADPVAIASRLQSQYPGQYPVIAPPGVVSPEPISSPTSSGPGPSANNRKLGLYKTELCRSWEEKGSCRYGSKCQFAHGEEELRRVARHPKYKTEICRTFWVSGTCPYGKRCCFIHTELPAAGTGPIPGGAQQLPENAQQVSDGRARSLSTNSDPNEANVSLLARINGKRNQDMPSSATPVDGTSFQFTRPPTGSLRVDTTVIDASLSKQNKSAYPSFASNGILLPAPDQALHKEPAPVTAGPDLGRHNNARREIVGYNQRTHKANTSSTSSIRDLDVQAGSSSPIPSYVLSSGDVNIRPNGHVRTGSAGNWGNFSRNSHLSQPSYGSANSGGDNSPWPAAEITVGAPRMHEKVWA